MQREDSKRAGWEPPLMGIEAFQQQLLKKEHLRLRANEGEKIQSEARHFPAN